MAGRPPAAHGVAGGAKKPWRYYFVIAFPLSNAVSKDKLQSMVELTSTIERREEEYLLKMADREPFQRSDEYHSPVPHYTASVLKWLSILAGILFVVALGCIWRFQQSAAGDDIDIRVFYAAYAIAACALGINAAIITAASIRHLTLLRFIAGILIIFIGACVFLLDELEAVMSSQRSLAQSLQAPRERLSDEAIALILNGGEHPSLWHRFFVDGPAWFLLWLERHCVKRLRDSASLTDDEQVDSSDFFTPLWEPRPRTCAISCLTSHLDIESVVRPALIAMVAMFTVQLLLCVLVIWTDQVSSEDGSTASAAASRKRKRHRNKRGRSQRQQDNSSLSPGESFSSFVYVCCAGLALTGGVIAGVSIAVLSTCAFVGPTESWAIALTAMFGISQILVACCAVFLWHQQFLKSILIGGLAIEWYVLSALSEYCLALSPALDKTAPVVGGDRTAFLRSAYATVFGQTCQPIKHWRLHVCVVKDSQSLLLHGPREAPYLSLFDSPVCQDEFSTLLRSTTEQALVLLTWMMAAQAVVLLWLLLPSLTSLVRGALAALTSRWSGQQRGQATARLNPDGGPATSKPQWKHSTMDLHDARRLYLSTLRHQDPATLEAETAAFDAEWAKLTHDEAKHNAVLFTYQLEAIIRVLVLRRLTTTCKLDVSLSLARDGKLLLAKVFASDNLLMTALCQRTASYKLQLAEAIDPGFSFWRSDREVKSDNKILDAHTVHQKFKLLTRNGVMTRKEAEIFPTESLARVSARVHALHRIHRWRSGSLRVHNAHPAFVGYVPHTQLQYLYRKHPNRMDTAATALQRRSAVLRTIDCVRLTRLLLDTELDLDLMQHHGLLHAVVPLHSASRFDFVSRQSLLASWVAFWTPRVLPGEFEPHAHWLLNQVGRLSPFRQPLHAVRDYFGEAIAFYFAWLAFYSQCLLAPAIAGAVLVATHVLDMSLWRQLIAFLHPEAGPNSTAFVLPRSSRVFGIAIVLWGVAFAKLWERRSVWYQLEWGMSGLADSAAHADRPNFRGESRRNPVTQQTEIHFPGHLRLRRQVLSLVVIAGVSTVSLVVSWLLLVAQGMAAEWVGVRLAVGGSALVLALLIQWNGDRISALSHRLSEWENYQSEPDFQRSVIFKVCVLQACNTYGPLLLTAFALYRVTASPLPLSLLDSWVHRFHTKIAPSVGVAVQLQLQLLLLFGTRIVSHIVLMLRGLVRGGSDSDVPSVENELALQGYRGAYEDYAEIVVQLGLVAMFSGVFPLASALAFVECALELRLDALDLCLFLQRPAPAMADGIGPWAACVRGVLQLGLAVNLALLYFASDEYSGWHSVRRVGAFLGATLVLWVAIECVWAVVPTESKAVHDVKARHAHVVERYFGGEDSIVAETDTATTLSDAERKALAQEEGEGEGEEADTAAHLQERLALLRRLNVALRKQDEAGDGEAAAPLSSAIVTEETKQDDEQEGDDIAVYRIDQTDAIEDHLAVGYFDQPASQEPASIDTTAAVDHPPEMRTAAAQQPSAAEPRGSHAEQSYARTSLAGMTAIHVATERQHFNFAQDPGWQPDNDHRQTSTSTSLSRRFSLFQSQRKSVGTTATAVTAAAPPPPPPPAAQVTTAYDIQRPVAVRARRSTAASRDDSGRLPVVQLSGLEAVHEATRRNQFDFSEDPWRESRASSSSNERQLP